MPQIAATTEFQVRERRLKSVLTYTGTAQDLNSKSHDLKLRNEKRPFQQSGDCSQMCAETLTYCIRDAAVVVHSPIGCCSTSSSSNIAIGVVARERGLTTGQQEVHAICTNIQEKDTVYGGAAKVREACQTAYDRWHSKAIFVQSSCAAGIVGDDLEGLTNEMSDKLGIPVIPVYCEGFKSRIWTSGFDAVFHGVLRKLVKPPEKKQPDLVNLFNFMGADTFGPLLGKLGLRVNYLLPMSDVETIEHMSEAACSAHICETLATYIARGLEEQYGVPEVRCTSPFGIKWTDEWLRAIAGYTGKQDVVEDVIASEHERIRPRLEELRAQLAGKRVYVYAGDSYAHSLTNMAMDLGMVPAGITTLHHDQRTDNDDERLNTLGTLVRDRGDIANFSVCNKQPYQMVKILRRVQPDLLIVRHQGLTITGFKLGIPTIYEGDVNVSAGYDGLLQLGDRMVSALKARGLLNEISSHAKLPYTQAWLDSPDEVYRGEL